jgi:hypothetical protein
MATSSSPILPGRSGAPTLRSRWEHTPAPRVGLMSKLVGCAVVAAVSFTACGGTSDSATQTAADADQTTPAASAEPSPVPAADSVASAESSTAVPAASSSGGDKAKLVCDAIIAVQADLATLPDVPMESYVIQLGLKLPNVLSEDQMKEPPDEVAVSKQCPEAYRTFLKQAQTSSLLGVAGSAPNQ